MTWLLSFCSNAAWRCKLFLLNDPWGRNHQPACRRRTVALLCEHATSVLIYNISLASLSFQFETTLYLCEACSCMWSCIIYKLCIPLGLREYLQKEKPIMMSWNRSNGSIVRCKTPIKPIHCIPTYTIIFQHLRLQAIYSLCLCVCVHVCVSALPHGCV